MKKNLYLLSLICFTAACGVKGDPLPPEKPANLGRGEPTYNRATEDLKFSELPPLEGENDRSTIDEDSDDDIE